MPSIVQALLGLSTCLFSVSSSRRGTRTLGARRHLGSLQPWLWLGATWPKLRGNLLGAGDFPPALTAAQPEGTHGLGVTSQGTDMAREGTPAWSPRASSLKSTSSPCWSQNPGERGGAWGQTDPRLCSCPSLSKRRPSRGPRFPHLLKGNQTFVPEVHFKDQMMTSAQLGWGGLR